MSRYRVALDIGGTFTDAVAYDEQTGTYAAGKSSTTPSDLTEGVFGALDTVLSAPGEVSFAVHGTTQGLNAFLERRGVKVLLLATPGAGDVLHIARGNRTRLYDLHFRKPVPLVPRRDIAEVGGRLDHEGTELEPLDEDAVRAAGRRARVEGFEAIAVALLFSYLQPAHELRAAELLREEAPEVAISLSHRVAREWREYERTSSTVIDAYVAPIVRRYLSRLTSQLEERGVGAPMHVMQSSGGIVSAQTASDQTLQTLLSGPVGGTMGGAALARLLGRPNLICVDMGGTSFDVSLVVDGVPDVSTEAELQGFPLLMPVVNIHTIGAGGGSLAYEEAGGLRVGPQSAGASPGPACYGRGGTEPTVTDANVVLGRVDPSWFAGGQMELDVAAAEGAMGELAESLELTSRALADGILAVINAKMAQAIRTLTVEKGIAPSDFALVAFGGAGSMHAAFLAQELEIPEVVVPRFPGAFSAWGMLETEIRTDFARSYFAMLADLDGPGLAAALAEQEAEALEALDAEAVGRAEIRVTHSLDVRYVGQEYTLSIEILDAGEPGRDAFALALQERFDTAHGGRFGHANPGAPIEMVTARTVALGDIGRAEPAPLAAGTPESSPGVMHEVVFDSSPVQTRVVRRDDLPAGTELDGPAVVLEPTATTVLPPAMRLRVEPHGALIIDTAGG